MRFYKLWVWVLVFGVKSTQDDFSITFPDQTLYEFNLGGIVWPVAVPEGVWSCTCYVWVYPQTAASILYMGLTGRQKTHLCLVQDLYGNFCLSRCFPFDQCDSFGFFSLLICINWVYGDSRRAHSTCPASELPFQQHTFFSFVYLTLLDHCEAITQAIMKVLRFFVIAFCETTLHCHWQVVGAALLFTGNITHI